MFSTTGRLLDRRYRTDRSVGMKAMARCKPLLEDLEVLVAILDFLMRD